LSYRPEVDGLRAIAIAIVVFYHARIRGFEGGYIGVDVFFVISGYLISQLLDASAEPNSLRRLLEFYVRRARRLLPALYVLLAVCVLLALVLFFPADLRKFGRSLLLTAGFLGNFGAWLDGGYFDAGERFTPLRHMWSIGVEEQFYLFFPVFLAVLARCRGKLRTLVLAMSAITSLTLACWAVDRWPIENFYMLPTRAWELLAGAICATYAPLSAASPRVNQILSLAGLIGLAGALWQAQVVHFPGMANYCACAATAALICSNSKSVTSIGRVLSWRPLTYTGLISYSLYLWHAPILAFYTYYRIQDPSGLELAVILPMIYLVASLSWAAVEQPFRRISLVKARVLVPAIAVPSMILLGGCGWWMMISDGLPSRFPPPPSLTRSGAEGAPIDVACLNMSNQTIASGGLCSFGASAANSRKALVWGDSHAFALLQAYRELAEASGVQIFYGVKGACWPLVGSEAASAGEYWRSRCAQFNAAMIGAIQHIRPDRVLLNAYWADPGASLQPEFFSRSPQKRATILEGIERTVEAVKEAGASVCAVLTVPGYSYPIPYALAMAQRRHIDASTLTITRAAAVQQYSIVEGEFRRLADEGLLEIADPKDALCPGSRCLILGQGGASLYRDSTHLSVSGARLLSGVLRRCVADLTR
jgi:peptidoglycan/LPS O-acetylase OafA/YrhL